MVEKKHSKVLILIALLVVVLTIILNLFTKRVSGNVNRLEVKKRGYILDRNLQPIVITLEKDRAYYLIKNGLFGSTYSPILRKYLGSALNLPKKGVILLSDDLSLDELEELKNEKNVVIERSFKRKLLDPDLRFLIGETFDGYGISGLEKVFDKTLKKGDPVILSIDYNIEKKLYNWAKSFKNCDIAIALFDLRTGELLGYVETGKEKLFNHFYETSIFGISKNSLKNFSWALESKNVIKLNKNSYITLWYLAKMYMEKVCKSPVNLKILYSNEKYLCNPDLSLLKNKKHIYLFDKGFISVYFRNKKMLIMVLKNRENPKFIGNKGLEVLNKKFDNIAFKIL